MNLDAPNEANRRHSDQQDRAAVAEHTNESADDRPDVPNQEDGDEHQGEGLSPTAWRNVKICLVVAGVLGNLAMRFGLVDISKSSLPTVWSVSETSLMISSQDSTQYLLTILVQHRRSRSSSTS